MVTGMTSCNPVVVRDEQYRIMWNELETLVKTHAGSTDRHQRVLDCIVACRSKPPEEEERKKRGRKREDREDRTEKNGNKDTEEKSWQDSERWDVSESLQLRGENVYERVCSGFNLQAKGFTGQRRPGTRGDQRFSRLSRTAQ